MNYFLYYIIIMTGIGALMTVSQVGKERPVITHAVAMLTVFWASANIVGYLWILGSLR